MKVSRSMVLLLGLLVVFIGTQAQKANIIVKPDGSTERVITSKELTQAKIEVSREMKTHGANAVKEIDATFKSAQLALEQRRSKLIKMARLATDLRVNGLELRDDAELAPYIHNLKAVEFKKSVKRRFGSWDHLVSVIREAGTIGRMTPAEKWTLNGGVVQIQLVGDLDTSEDGPNYYKNAGRWLQAPKAFDKDKRDSSSNYVSVHASSKTARKWRIVPNGDGTVQFQLVGDLDGSEGGPDYYKNAGSWLQAPNWKSDKRDNGSNYVAVHKSSKTARRWRLVSNFKDETVQIQLVGDIDKSSHAGKDYYKNAGRWLQAPAWSDKDKRDGSSNYVSVHASSKTARKWRIVAT